MHAKTWTAHIFISEEGSTTKARAVLITNEGRDTLHGEGVAHRYAADPDVPEIGDEVATSRALFALGNALSDAAIQDLRAVARSAALRG